MTERTPWLNYDLVIDISTTFHDELSARCFIGLVNGNSNYLFFLYLDSFEFITGLPFVVKLIIFPLRKLFTPLSDQTRQICSNRIQWLYDKLSL